MGFDGCQRGDPQFLLSLAADYRELREHLRHPPVQSPGLTQKYLAYAWGVNKDAPREAYNKQQSGITRHFRRQGGTREENFEQNRELMKSVIECRQSAKSVYMPFMLYDKHSVARFKDNNLHIDPEELSEYQSKSMTRWKKLPTSTKEIWIAEACCHNARFPQIKDSLIILLQNNPSIGYFQLASEIGEWCSAKTIHKWLTSQVRFSYYNERIIPLLTTKQREKHVSFSRHFWNHWGLPKDKLKKVLLINYDEKWFYGMVPRSQAKKCDNLPIYRKHLQAYHKCYINKVMIIAVTGYAFRGSMENGGGGGWT